MLKRLVARGIEVRPLHVALAAHSPLVEPMLDKFDALVRAVAPRAPRVAWASPVTRGASAAGEPLPPTIGGRNVRETVRFAAAAAALDRGGVDAWLEIGPDADAHRHGARDLSPRPVAAVAAPQPRRLRFRWPRASACFTRSAAGRLGRWFKHFACRRVEPAHLSVRAPALLVHSGRGAPTASPMGRAAHRARDAVAARARADLREPLDPAGLSLLADHRVGEQGVWPAAATLELAFEAAREAFGPEPVELLDVTIHEPLGLDSAAPCNAS